MHYDIAITNVEILEKDDFVSYNIGISKDKIAFIGQEPIVADKIIDGSSLIAAPGMVNTHTHLAMTLLRSYADDMVLMDWLQTKIWPAEAKLTKEAVYWGSLLGIAEMLKSGSTTFCDMYFEMEETAKAVEETGVRALLSRGLIGSAPDGEEKIKENIDLFKNWHNHANGRIRVYFGPHAPYTCPLNYLDKVMNAAAELGTGLHMHLAETRGEVNDCLTEHGLTPIALMNKIGMLDFPFIAAHCVHVNDEDIDILAAKHVGVAHNPQSNLKLASGIAPVAMMLDKNVHVGLGTDGCSSNNNLDMLEEARLVAMLQKNQTGDPTVIPAVKALRMVTTEGSQMLGFNEVKGVQTGAKADIVLYDLNKPYWYPKHDRISAFIYAASAGDADTTIVNGKVLMEKGELLFIDEEKSYAEANKYAQQMVQK